MAAKEGDLKEIKVIDIMNYLFTPEAKTEYQTSEEAQYIERRFAGGTGAQRAQVQFPTATDYVRFMDEVGYEKTIISGLKMFSHRNKKMIMDRTVDQVYEQTKQFPERLIGGAGYNPLRIEESLKDIDRAVKKLGFKYVYIHGLSFNLPPNDKKFYPLYAKCNELGIPVGMQVGHSAENLPSEPGRPIYIDEVALDFPNLTIILSHTGWPWVEEVVAMAMKHENVYCDTSAWWPRQLPKMHAPLVAFMDSRIGSQKVLFGTNGRALKEYREEFLELAIRDDNKRPILRENAIKVFKLSGEKASIIPNRAIVCD